MELEKKTYYIDLNSKEILEQPLESSPSFKIRANYEEIAMLKEFFYETDSADLETFGRAHIPFREYHYDPENTRYDTSLQKIYALIYELGDEEARQHIEQIGVLNERKSNESTTEIEKFK